MKKIILLVNPVGERGSRISSTLGWIVNSQLVRLALLKWSSFL